MNKNLVHHWEVASRRQFFQRAGSGPIMAASLREPFLVGDPFVKRIGELTFQAGLAESRDMEILKLIVEEYVVVGAYSDAALVWQLVGSRAAMETTSFRERYNLNPLTYGSRLAELFRLSGYERRATLVTNMLKSMKDSNGLHL
jgi:hypothetical protein